MSEHQAMLSSVKDALRRLAYRGGLLGWMHRLRNRKALTVLMFHRVLPDGDARLALAERDFTMTLSGFQRTLDFVAKHYQVVQLQEVQQWASGKGELPPCPVLLTFDDGWRDTLVHAAPELQRRHWSAVLFMASEVSDLQAPRWWQDALVQAMADPDTRRRLWSAAGFEGDALARDAVWRLTACLAAWTETERVAWLDRHAPGVMDAIAARQMLAGTELAHLERAALEVAGHGHTHAPLTLVTDPAAELDTSLRFVRQHHSGVAAMSFPHGAWSQALVVQARQAGFELMFNSVPTLARRTDQGHSLTMPLGRIHLPENPWTCHKGAMDASKLASFLFFRQHAPVPATP